MMKIRAGLFAAAAAFALATPALSHEAEGDAAEIMIGDGDLLEKLIAMDADDIAEMRQSIAEARREIEESIADIEDARAELADAPGGRFIVKIAFAAAAEATQEAVREALTEAYARIDDAEERLADADVSEGERIETQGAIDGLRDDLASLEDALEGLMAALEA